MYTLAWDLTTVHCVRNHHPLSITLTFPFLNPHFNTQIVEINILQTLTIDGLVALTLTPEIKAALVAAYLNEFPNLIESNILFGDPTVTNSNAERTRRLGSRTRRLNGNNFAIPVEITTLPEDTTSVGQGLGGSSFADSITTELANTGETVTIEEQVSTGLDVLFAVKAPTTSDIQAEIVNNEDFATQITNKAIENNIIGQDAIVVADRTMVVISTMAPTPKPTAFPSPAPTASPSNVGETNGDPHLVGFSGQKFDLYGQAGRIYELVRDEFVLLAAKIDYPFFEHSTDSAIRDGEGPLKITHLSHF